MQDKGLFEQLDISNIYPLTSHRITWINFKNEYIKEKCKGIINTDSPLFQLYLQASNQDWKEAIKQYRKKKYEQKCTNIIYKTK